ncbi:MAG TPA: hypothetical protein VLS28_07970 [Candidatus Sulfomarinibacteraceae bacterium]|nr:hypothetical protein [Candidatus Sulfomarinibacteraceae bacterium]
MVKTDQGNALWQHAKARCGLGPGTTSECPLPSGEIVQDVGTRTAH